MGDQQLIVVAHALYKQAKLKCNQTVATAKREYFTKFIVDQVENPTDTAQNMETNTDHEKCSPRTRHATYAQEH